MGLESDQDRYDRQLEEALAVGLAGIADGLLIDADDVFDELEARYADRTADTKSR